MKLRSAIIAFLLVLISVGSTYAATDVTGEVYGETIATMTMNDGGVPYGVTIDDINAGEDCDNATQTCYVKGFSWADTIGWTYWDGEGLQTELGAGVFPDEYIAKATYNGNLGGYIWGEKFGWISLSICDGLAQVDCNTKAYCNWTGNNYCEINKANQVTGVGSQSVSNWGAYVDFCPLKSTQPSCESVESNPYCNWDAVDSKCIFDSAANPNGQPLRGFAWSQYLGWLKFGPAVGEIEFTGAFTNWFPDLTPPTLEALNTDKAWIPNDSAAGTISWLEFADEDDSAVDLINSSITVNTDLGADFTGCPLAAAQSNGNLVISQNGGTGAVNLSIPLIGIIGTPPHGFCKYTMGGVIYNGSGFGYYFGLEGATAAAADGVNILSPAPNVYDAAAVTLYVRAGDLDLASSSLSFAGAGGVADGNDSIDLTFGPKDVGGNPIISVKSALVPAALPEGTQANWVRDVELLYDFDTNSDYGFDVINVTRNLTLPAPVDIGTQLYSYINTLQYPFAGAASTGHSSGDYLLDTLGFAPTTSVGNVLELNSVYLETVDKTIPALSPIMPAVDTSASTTIDNSSVALPANPLPYAYDFNPAFEVTGGNLDATFISIGQPVEATYNLLNNSSDILDEYSLDHTLTFTNISGGIGKEVLEINNINLSSLPADTAGRTDPDATETRYSLLKSSADDEQSNQFHDSGQNYHAPIYSFNTNANVSGIYQVNGALYVKPNDPCLPAACTPVDIDRSDPLGFNVAGGGGTGIFAFDFTPAQFIGQPLSAQVEFGITQYLSYSAKASPYYQNQSAIYSANAYIDGVEVKSIGLGTTGLVSGGQVFETVGGRDLETISTTSSADLRREIRKNVAVLTRSITPCSAPQTLSSLPTTNGGCIAVDSVNDTVVAVYSGPGTITLDPVVNLTIPTGYKYTIILLDGANLYIKDNIIYDDPGTSFGMILIQDSSGNGGNVYLDPAPTNIVGLLYSEGSLLSTPNAGTTFYYGGGANANDLKNQLYWQGSIASRNTIGGASSKIVPDNVSCTAWGGSAENCSQAHDLDFIRRFTTLNDTGVDFAPVGYLYSGGGSCTVGSAPNPGCTNPGTLPTTVTLTGDSIDVSNSKSLDTFFIEGDNRAVPPGFSSSGGLTSSQEIR